MLKQQHSDKGWVRGTAVIVEWTMSSFFVVFIATFVPEFKKLGYKSPQIFFTVIVQSSGDIIIENSPQKIPEDVLGSTTETASNEPVAS